jgi:hypothetical protein
MIERDRTKQGELALDKAALPARPVEFDSLSEKVCAALLERYVPGWRAIMGETVQIPVDSKRIDFKVKQTWVEYHPISHSHEWDNRRAFYHLQETLRRFPLHAQKAVWGALREEFETKYYRRRRALLDLTGHQREPLIVAHSPVDFYRQVLKPLGQCPLNEKAFLREWSRLINSLSSSRH